ncbi:MAG: ATP-binding protein [Trueperaceae bacterium]|nr:ATP-binding protein [Trueperaceae bacterium]
MIQRRIEPLLRDALRREPVVALLGPRRVGKTTLALEVARSWPGEVVVLDLERPSHAARLRDPELYLHAHRDALVVLDEVQRVPELLSSLPALVAAQRGPGRLLLVGPASLELLPGASDHLAGRIPTLELGPLSLAEVGATAEHVHRLWSRGGFPGSFLAATDADSLDWRRAYVRSFVERDLPGLGLKLPPERMRRFWTMVAHRHGQPWNASDLARGLAVAPPTAGWYADLFVDASLVRRLEPLRANVTKRLVKSPKLYVRDSGLLHALLDVPDWDALQGHPIAGLSWEGFVVEELLATRPDADAAFYRTATGVELDLVLREGGATTAFAVEYGSPRSRTRGFWRAVADVRPDRTFVVHSGESSWPLRVGVEARSVLELPNRRRRR